ncbi:Fc.00g099930.m01.CDS01 [Cosmosporella sp. VM-42]
MSARSPASSEPKLERNDTLPPEAHATPQDAPIIYPSKLRQSFIVTGLLLGIFLAGLDISIIATAIPAITNDFNSLDDSGWYGSIFFLCYAAFQSLWGKAYKYFDMKYVFVCAILIFEVGCLIGGVSPNSPALIAGRAIQGSGAAGILLGCYSISNFIAPPDRVPIIVGMIGTVFSIASVIGPLLGGVFTSDATWRWVFYVNLPIGVVPLTFILFFFKTPAHAKLSEKASFKEIAASFDPVGLVCLVASLICYFLALAWGGIERPWNSPQVIGLLVGWILFTIAFFINEVWQGERALLVLRVLKIEGIFVGCVYLFFLYGAYFAVVYNLPTYFQATAGLSPRDSGIRSIPIICSSSIVTFISSVALGKVRKYNLLLLVGAAISAISGGLIYTFDVDTSLGKQIGYQILLGTGVGLVVQVPPIVAGAVSSDADKAIALSAVLVTQFYSAALVIAASSAITNNLLIRNVLKYAPGVAPDEVFGVGPYELEAYFSGDNLRGIRHAYVEGLRGAWALGIGLWGVSCFLPFLAKWPGRMDPVKGSDGKDMEVSC